MSHDGDPTTRRSWLRSLREPRPDGWSDVGVALGLGALYVLLLLRTVDTVGYARDEGFYFMAARNYQAWFELLWRDPGQALARVDTYWRYNSEHPALVKSLFALSNLWLQKRWHLFAMEGTSFRFPAMVLSGLGLGLVYLWGARAHGRLAGIVAALSLGLMPRFFFHAHLACFDAPVVTMWTLCAYSYWRALERGGWGRALLVGVTFGLALDTKHNSWFLPIVCLLHAASIQLGIGLRRLAERRHGAGSATSGAACRPLLGRSVAALASMALVGPAVCYALWPWIWRHTFDRLAAYAQFHLSHVYYNMEFLGRNYWQPPMPRSYALVMTVATVPAITLLLFALGLAVACRREARPVALLLRRAWAGLWHPVADGAGAGGAASVPREPGAATSLLWLLALCVQYGAWLSPQTPIFGGTKHWMTAYPFLTLFAGLGVRAAVGYAERAVATVGGGRLARASAAGRLELVFATSVLAAPFIEALHAHPWGLSAYSPLVGGAAGGATLGLNRGFWGYTTGALARYLNEAAPPRATVYVHDTAAPAWEMLLADGRVRRGIQAVGSVAGADFGLYHHELHMQGQEYQGWVAFGTAQPDYVAGLDAVPVIWAYRKPVSPSGHGASGPR